MIPPSAPDVIPELGPGLTANSRKQKAAIADKLPGVSQRHPEQTKASRRVGSARLLDPRVDDPTVKRTRIVNHRKPVADNAQHSGGIILPQVS